jgi:predicted transcriptional regulator of viral defense system
MRIKSILLTVRELGNRIFTTHEACISSGKSLSAVTQSLNNLVKDGILVKIYRGIWMYESQEAISPYAVIPYLFPKDRTYVSFVSALHLHGIIEQIPQVATLATTSRTSVIHTKLGDFQAHHIAPSFFDGFNWYKDHGNFLIAEPEKALVDCLYLSAYKNNRYAYFPEMNFPKSFSFKNAKKWTNKIQSRSARSYVMSKLQNIIKKYN